MSNMFEARSSWAAILRNLMYISCGFFQLISYGESIFKPLDNAIRSRPMCFLFLFLFSFIFTWKAGYKKSADLLQLIFQAKISSIFCWLHEWLTHWNNLKETVTRLPKIVFWARQTHTHHTVHITNNWLINVAWHNVFICNCECLCV